MSSPSFCPPASILILGSGEFGLSTAYGLAKNPAFKDTKLTLVDRSEFPAPDGSSIDVSRLIRSDYIDFEYAQLAIEAQQRWRTEWWGKDAYRETGRALCIQRQSDANDPSYGPDAYFWAEIENGKKLGLKQGTRASGCDLELLQTKEAIHSVFNQPPDASHGDMFGADMCAVNWRAGWADAETAMRNLREKTVELDRVEFVHGQVTRLLFDKTPDDKDTVRGAILSTGQELTADLTILATGAWSPALLDMRGVASATGQILAYLDISETEQQALGENPSVVTGGSVYFILPPSKGVIRVAQHAYGYANPTAVPYPEPIDAFAHDRKTSSTSAPSSNAPPAPSHLTVSLPKTSRDGPVNIPRQDRISFKHCLDQFYPCFADRAEFSRVRLCWYLDTVNGDFLIGYHPRYGKRSAPRSADDGTKDKSVTGAFPQAPSGLFVATAGNGHAFKFLPVLGDKIVDAIMGTLEPALADKWAWPAERNAAEHIWTNDYRAGPKGLILAHELEKA